MQIMGENQFARAAQPKRPIPVQAWPSRANRRGVVSAWWALGRARLDNITSAPFSDMFDIKTFVAEVQSMKPAERDVFLDKLLSAVALIYDAGPKTLPHPSTSSPLSPSLPSPPPSPEHHPWPFGRFLN